MQAAEMELAAQARLADGAWQGTLRNRVNISETAKTSFRRSERVESL